MITPWWGLEPTPGLAHAEAILGAAHGLEAAILAGRIPTDKLLADHTRAKKGAMGSRDRALLGLAAYGLARNRALIAKAVGERGRPGAWLTLALADSLSDRGAGVSEGLGRLEELRARALEAVEGAAGKGIGELSPPEAGAFADLFSIPPFWLALGPWRGAADAIRELNAGKFQQKPQLRADGGAEGRERALGRLAGLGVRARPLERSPWGIELGSRVGSGVADSLGVEFQDEGSQLAALACLPLERGWKALDYCAGAGGKGLALAANSEASVFLHDADRGRLARALPRIRRARLTNIAPLDDPGSEAPFDLVLVDAPCSSSGTLRRNPSIGARWTQSEVLGLARTQAAILREGGALVKPGGLLVYVTCSLLTCENFAVVEEFLSGGGFTPEGVEGAAFAGVEGAESGVFRLPLNLAGYAGDGFFCARLRKA